MGGFYSCDVKNRDQQCEHFTPKHNRQPVHSCRTCCFNRAPWSKGVMTVEQAVAQGSRTQIRDMLKQTFSARAASEYEECVDQQGFLHARPMFLPMCPVLSFPNEGRCAVGPIVNSAERCLHWRSDVPIEGLVQNQINSNLNALRARAQQAQAYRAHHVAQFGSSLFEGSSQEMSAAADVIAYCLLTLGMDEGSVQSVGDMYGEMFFLSNERYQLSPDLVQAAAAPLEMRKTNENQAEVNRSLRRQLLLAAQERAAKEDPPAVATSATTPPTLGGASPTGRITQGTPSSMPPHSTPSTAATPSLPSASEVPPHISEAGVAVSSSSEVYLDPVTGLLWTVADNGRDISWSDARRYPMTLRLGGFSDWRLPTIEELEALADPTSVQSGIRAPFELTGLFHWCSAEDLSHPVLAYSFCYKARGGAVEIFGEDAAMAHRDAPTPNARVLCVRLPKTAPQATRKPWSHVASAAPSPELRDQTRDREIDDEQTKEGALAGSAQDAMDLGFEFAESGQYDRAAEQYLIAYQKGEPEGAAQLGDIYACGYGRKQDYQQALDWYRKAWAKGVIDVARPGPAFELGYGYRIDSDFRRLFLQEALSGLRRAADSGDAGAAGKAGRLLADNVGNPADHRAALRYLQLGVTQDSRVGAGSACTTKQLNFMMLAKASRGIRNGLSNTCFGHLSWTTVSPSF